MGYCGRWGLAFWLFLVSASAQAGSREEVRERAARKACMAGDFRKGVSILSDLFLDTKDPTYVYNQGRCFEQNGRFGDALLRFEEYLRIAGTLSDDDKAEAQKHIADCQKRLGRESAPIVAASAPTPAAGRTIAGEPIQAAVAASFQSPIYARQTKQQLFADSGSGLRTAGVVVAAVGGLALVAGVAFNLKVNSVARDYETRGGYTRSKESDRATYEALGWGSYGVGAAGVVTGALLYFLGSRPGTDASSSAVAVVPALGAGEAGAVLKGAF